MASRDQWSEYKRLVINELETLKEKSDRLERGLAAAQSKIAVLESSSPTKEDLAELQSTARVWGAVAGTIPVVIGIVVALVTLFMSL